MKTFVFSLDNKKIYNLKDCNSNAVYHDISSGPCFGIRRDIALDDDPIKQKKLYTCQLSFDYKGDKHSLSECIYDRKGKALEYEVFQVIFYWINA